MTLNILYTVAALDSLSFTMAITTLAPYIYSLGGTQFYLGVIGSMGAFISLIWNPIVGSLSDRLGRKIVLLQCLFICFIGNLFFTLSSSLIIIFFSRLITAFGTQIMTLIKSLMDDNISPSQDKMSAINKMFAFNGIFFIFGALLSGYLSEYENGVIYVYYLICGIFALNFGLICLVKDRKTKQSKEKDHGEKSLNVLKEITLAAKNLSNIDWSKYWDLFVIKLIADLVLNVFHFNSSLMFTKRFHLFGKSLGFVFASMGIMGIITNLMMTKVKEYFYSKDESGLSRLLHSNILLLLTYVGVGMSTTFSFYMLCLIPMSIARALLETTFTEILLSRASPEEKGSIMGTFDSTVFLGGLICPVLSGIISDVWGENICILLCTVPLAIGTILTYFQKNKLY